MTTLKCKMCGGALELKAGETVAECPYCGTKQTIPLMDDDRKAQLFDRANRLRSACSFDRALAVYENIISLFPEEAEAYWGELLCKYGIEYVDDPGTGKKVPTCHRSSYDSILEDESYEMVMEYASPDAKQIYRNEARQIEEIRKGINAVSAKEEPYDIFICYKETDDRGNRSIDSVIAQDVYDALTEKGYRVFFSRITLEDKLGTEFEPYIFGALNTAKIMLVFGTEQDYFNAVWVKNEWSRFLSLMSKDRTKVLIPCYKNIEISDLPKEFAKFQAQDMGKVGAIQDLLRGINKILPKAKQQDNQTMNVGVSSTNSKELVKLGYLALEDEKWEEAANSFKQSLTGNAENCYAYFGLALAEKHASKPEVLPVTLTEGIPSSEEKIPLTNDNLASDIISKYEVPGFLSKDMIVKKLDQVVTFPVTANLLATKKQELEKYYETDANITKARRFGDDKFNESITHLKDETLRLIDSLISEAPLKDEQAKKDALERQKQLLDKTITQIEQEYNQAIQQKKLHESLASKKKKQKLILTLTAIVVLVLGISGYLWYAKIYLPQSHYAKAISYMNNEQWDEAISEFKLSGNTNNDKYQECEYYSAVSKFDSGDINGARPIFEKNAGYNDSNYYLMIDITSKSDYDAIKELENYLTDHPNTTHSSDINSMIQVIRVRLKDELTEKIKKDKSTTIHVWEAELFAETKINESFIEQKKWNVTYSSGQGIYLIFYDNGTVDFNGHGTSWPWKINDTNKLQITASTESYGVKIGTHTTYYLFRQISDSLYLVEASDNGQGYSFEIWEKE